MKITKKQRDKLWGDTGPYSEANLTKQTRILDNRVSRIFAIVEASINPLTFEIVEQNRSYFKDDIIIQQLLDMAEYRGQGFGYVVSAFEKELTDETVWIEAQERLAYTEDSLIKMHEFVMDFLDIKV